MREGEGNEKRKREEKQEKKGKFVTAIFKDSIHVSKIADMGTAVLSALSTFTEKTARTHTTEHAICPSGRGVKSLCLSKND